MVPTPPSLEQFVGTLDVSMLIQPEKRIVASDRCALQGQGVPGKKAEGPGEGEERNDAFDPAVTMPEGEVGNDAGGQDGSGASGAPTAPKTYLEGFAVRLTCLALYLV